MNQEALADKLMHYIRTDSIPENLLDEMNRFPLVDALRERVSALDVPTILSLIKSPDRNKCYLGLNLVNQVQNNASIPNELNALWISWKDIERKYFLMWPILNYADLPQEKHEEIYNFILENWELWKNNYIIFAGGIENLLIFSGARFRDNKFPESKKWVYLLSLKALANKDEINAALTHFDTNKLDEMQNTVLLFLKN